jgi:hypothetical protein
LNKGLSDEQISEIMTWGRILSEDEKEQIIQLIQILGLNEAMDKIYDFLKEEEQNG